MALAEQQAGADGLDQPAGLRERKKRRTRETILRVGLAMMAERGFRATTLPAIAAASDVSPRTVSTYFPSKEDILFKTDGSPVETLRVYVQERDPGESLYDALRRWMIHRLEYFETSEARLRRRIIDADDRLRALEQQRFHLTSQILVEAIAEELGMLPTDLRPRIVAAAIFATLGVPRADVERGTVTSREETIAAIDLAFAFLSDGIRAYRK